MTNNNERKKWNWGHVNDFFVTDAAYMRAKVITLGYTIPQSLVETVGLERLRFSVTGNDLFVIDNIKDGLDPENGSSAGRSDVDPFVRSVMFSVQATF